MLRIGERVEFTNDFDIVTEITNTRIRVKKGDKAIVTSEGFKIITGEGAGKINAFNKGDKVMKEDRSSTSDRIAGLMEAIF